jgi:hypothetical protein
MTDYVFPMSLPGIGMKLTREPYTQVTVQEAASGRELRDTWWTLPRYRYKLSLDFMRSTAALLEYQQILSFFVRQFGQYGSFLIVDPDDNAVTNHGFWYNGGVLAPTQTAQLQRSMLGDVYDNMGGPWATSSIERTNLLLHSDDLTATWSTVNSSITSNAIVAPDNSLTADAIVEASDTGQWHGVYQNATLAASTTYCYSVFLKRGTGTRDAAVQILDKAGTCHVVIVNLTTGATTVNMGSPISYGCTQCYGGWWRAWVVVGSATGGSTSNVAVRLASGSTTVYNGDGTSSIYAWGNQLEATTRPTLKITTTTAAVTMVPNYYPLFNDGFEPVWDIVPGPIIMTNGVVMDPADYTISSTGLFTYTGSILYGAHNLTWTGTYFKRVRFAQAGFSAERIVRDLWKASSIDLITVRP